LKNLIQDNYKKKMEEKYDSSNEKIKTIINASEEEEEDDLSASLSESLTISNPIRKKQKVSSPTSINDKTTFTTVTNPLNKKTKFIEYQKIKKTESNNEICSFFSNTYPKEIDNSIQKYCLLSKFPNKMIDYQKKKKNLGSIDSFEKTNENNENNDNNININNNNKNNNDLNPFFLPLDFITITSNWTLFKYTFSKKFINCKWFI
jgi:hypothetical protein